jgi:arsenite methyltransferase
MLEIVGERGHVCGVDRAEPMVDMAGRLCPKSLFLRGDAANLPVADLSCDAVTASQLLCFVPEIDKALSEMFRVLKHDGRLVILDSDWGSLVWNCRNQNLMDRTIEMLTGPYADAHVPRTLSRRLIAAGFEITGRHTFTVLNWNPDPDSYSQQTIGFVKPMMEASDAFTKEDWATWIADQKATADAGEYMFSLNRYIFSAARP